MARETHRLSDAKIRASTIKDKAYKINDGGSLYVDVMPSGSKKWRYKYRLGDKHRTFTIGNYGSREGEYTLKQARMERDRAAELVSRGIDPVQSRQAIKATNITAGASTFAAMAAEWLAEHKQQVSAGHYAKQEPRVRKYLLPFLGPLPVAEVTAPVILNCLNKQVQVGNLENARRCRVIVGQILRHAMFKGLIDVDPTISLRDKLPTNKGEDRHHAAITDPKELPGLMRAIQGLSAQPATYAALRIAPMVFVRPNELRKVKWIDLDLDEGVWNYVSSKTRTPIVIPLPKQAVQILRELHPVTGMKDYVFPSTRGLGRPMSEGTLNAALNRLGYAGQMTPHGFRATARTLLVERLGYEESWVEQQLAHRVKDSNGRAYNRTKFFEQRREMLQAWADYLEAIQHPSANVVPINNRA